MLPDPRNARTALSYYLGMFLLLFFLVISIMRHIGDVRLEEAIILIALAATILFAILAAWRGAGGAKKKTELEEEELRETGYPEDDSSR